MVKKKRSVKSRIAKEDEELVNKRITIGAILTLVFLVLFLFTQLETRKEQIVVRFDDLTPDQKIQTVQLSEQEIADNTNYQRALTLQDRVYCELVQDASLKATCISKTPELVEKEPVEEKTEIEISDQTNYQRALTFGNAVYCDLISNVQLRTDCLKSLEG